MFGHEAFGCGLYIVVMYPLGAEDSAQILTVFLKIRRVQLLRQRENSCLKLLPQVGTIHNDFVIGGSASGVLTSVVTGAKC